MSHQDNPVQSIHEDHEIVIERCPHDRQNPYLMVSRAMIQDSSISPHARGVLAYLLSLPPHWQIYHTQLCDALGIGKDALNGGFHELMKAGYMDRTRERVKGKYQPYRYVIREFKVDRSATEKGQKPAHNACEPKRVHRSGSTAAGNPHLIKKEEEKKEEEKKENATQYRAGVSTEEASATLRCASFLPCGREEKEKESPKREKDQERPLKAQGAEKEGGGLSSPSEAKDTASESISVGPVDVRGNPIDIDALKSDIYYQLCGSYDGGTIAAAIERVRATRSAIGDVFKLTKTICDAILAETRAAPRPKKSSNGPVQPPSHVLATAYAPTVNWGEYHKSKEEQKL